MQAIMARSAGLAEAGILFQLLMPYAFLEPLHTNYSGGLA